MARAVQTFFVAVAIFGHLAVAWRWRQTTCVAGVAALIPQAGMTKLDCDTIRDDSLTNLATCRLRDALGFLDIQTTDFRAALRFSGCNAPVLIPTIHPGCGNLEVCLRIVRDVVFKEGDFDCVVDKEKTAEAIACLDEVIAEGCVAVGKKNKSIYYRASCRLCY